MVQSQSGNKNGMAVFMWIYLIVLIAYCVYSVWSSEKERNKRSEQRERGLSEIASNFEMLNQWNDDMSRRLDALENPAKKTRVRKRK